MLPENKTKVNMTLEKYPQAGEIRHILYVIPFAKRGQWKPFRINTLVRI